MTRQEILAKAIEKATAGGWEAPNWVQGPQHYAQTLIHSGTEYSIIFHHDFARALWGEEDTTTHFEYPNGRPSTEPIQPVKLPAWQYHLQMMVIAADPVKYLGEHL